MSAPITLTHPRLDRRKTFNSQAEADRYFAAGWLEVESDEPSAVEPPEPTSRTIPEVLEEVAGDSARATAYLAAERNRIDPRSGRPAPRSSLITQLEQIASSEPHDTPDDGEKETEL